MAKIDDIKVNLDLSDSFDLVAKYLEENIPSEFTITIENMVEHLRNRSRIEKGSDNANS
jgi:hypothetical protein